EGMGESGGGTERVLISTRTTLRRRSLSTAMLFGQRCPPRTFSGMLDPDFAPRSSLFLFDKKWGFVTGPLSLVPRRIFNRCTGFIFTKGILPAAVAAVALLTRFARNPTTAGLAIHRL